MTQCDYKNSDDSLELFETIVGRRAKFFKHTGLFWWSDYEEVEYGTKGGFWTGAVRTEADYNVNMEYLFVDWDLQTVLTTFITVGAVILATIFVKEVAVPYIVENVSALFYCIKTFGVYNGINFFLTFGTETKPLADGIVSAVQADMSDGDCDLVSVIEQFIEKDYIDGDSNIDDIWAKITPTQECYANTVIPKSFVIEVGENKFWVHANGTKHMYQDFLSVMTKYSRDSQGIIEPNLYTQILISDFYGSLQLAIQNGIEYETIILSGNWEFIIALPREEGLLNVIKHAVFRGWH